MNFNSDDRMFSFGLILFIFCLFICVFDLMADDDLYQEYTVNRGDQLIITIVGYSGDQPEPVIVRPDGMITYGDAGEIKAAGLTISQLSASIRDKLVKSGYYADPRVTVQFKESSQFGVYVIGEVSDPGQKNFARPVSVIEALASVGGYLRNADLANATIIRQKKKIIPINLEFLKSDPKTQESQVNEIPDENFILTSGDVLSIPSIMKEKQLSVIGHVHKPGVFSVSMNVNIIEALALVEGALEDTADLRNIMVISDYGTKTINAMEIWNAENIKNSPAYERSIKPGDCVIVPEIGKISILGIVEKQGRYPISDKISIVEALSLSGIKDNADLKKVKVVRANGEELTLDMSKLWKQPNLYCQEMINSGDIIIVPAKRFAINWNAVYSAVMVFSTLYAVFK